MRKTSLLAILILALGAVTSTLTIRPAEAFVSDSDWLGQVHYYDPYWNTNLVTVFPENSTARLMVEVYNHLSDPLNVSAVKVWLDWNQNYSSYEGGVSVDTPLVIQPGAYHTFSIAFTVPSTSIASNLVKHSYIIYVEEVNATTGPKQVSIHALHYLPDVFIVYSTIQKEAQKLYDELYLLNPTSISWTFQSKQAERLWNNGTLEYQFGERSHEVGDFSTAKAHYETALEMLYQAISTETSYQTSDQSYSDDYNRRLAEVTILQGQASVALTQAQAEYTRANATYLEAIANATMKKADATMMEANATMKRAEAEFAIAEAIKMQANAWVVFGLGFIVFGFAAVVWAYRRPIPSPSS